MRGYRYRVYPTPSQQAELERWMSLSCWVWNSALEQRMMAYRMSGVSLQSRSAWHPVAGTDLSRSQTRELQDARSAIPDLAMPAQVQNAVLLRLDRAYEAFFRRVRTAGAKGGHPRFRSHYDSVDLPSYGQSHRWIESRGRVGYLDVRGLGAFKVRLHRPLPVEHLGKATIMRQPDGTWSVALTVRETPVHESAAAGGRVGINRGVHHLYATSDGELVDGLRVSPEHERQWRAADKALSRAQRGSSGRRRARHHRAKVHAAIAAAREQRIGELARSLVQRYEVIVIEDMGTARMIEHAEETHVNGLARRLSEQCWALLERRLRDRCEEYGRTLLVVDAKLISQLCPECGRRTDHAPEARVFGCACGYMAHRDIAAACNVLLRGDDPQMTREGSGPQTSPGSARKSGSAGKLGSTEPGGRRNGRVERGNSRAVKPNLRTGKGTPRKRGPDPAPALAAAAELSE